MPMPWPQPCPVTDTPVADVPVTWKKSDLRPRSSANSGPVTCFGPADPNTVILLTRPNVWPGGFPGPVVTVPTCENVPIDQAPWIDAAEIVAVHEWFGFVAMPSPVSGTGVNGDVWPGPDVYPPVDAEYSVVAIDPFGMNITWPAVSDAAAIVVGVSYFVPRYVWHDRSHVSA